MGQTCKCVSRRFEPEIVSYGYETNGAPAQNPPQDKVTGSLNSQDDYQDYNGKNQSQTPLPDPIQLEDYSWEKNKPNDTYAKPLTLQEEIDFKLEEKVQAQFRKTKNITIKTTSENYRRIPRDSTPYLILENNFIYVGQWVKGMPFGVGCLYMKKNSDNVYEEMYQGQVENSIPHGYGQMIWKDGTKYEGNFVNGVIEGAGRIKRPDKFVYDGQWKQCKPHGKGNESIADKYIYNGEYFEGMKHGKGKFTWFIRIKGKTNEFQEESYEGEFKDNLFDGKGGYYWLDGRKYDGSWKQGKMEGYGIFEWADKRKYQGQYLNDLKHGEGELFWPDGKRIKGNWVAGKLDGICELFIGQKSYKGEWENGVRVKWIKDDDQRLSQISNNEGSRISLGIPIEINQILQDKEVSLIRQNDQLGGRKVSIRQNNLNISKQQSSDIRFQDNLQVKSQNENQQITPQKSIQNIQNTNNQKPEKKVEQEKSINNQYMGSKVGSYNNFEYIEQDEPKSQIPFCINLKHNNLYVQENNQDQKSISQRKQSSNSLQQNDKQENQQNIQENINEQREGQLAN